MASVLLLLAALAVLVTSDRPVRSDDPQPLEAAVAQQAQELSALKAELAAMRTELNTKGSTFVRWGRTRCPDGAAIIYSGYAGGSDAGSTGSGANRLCLSSDPVFDGKSHPSETGKLYGAQYWTSIHQYTDVLCALCHTSHSATFMVPGTNRCPSGSVLQYHGYLTSGQNNHAAQTEFVCLDSQPEDRTASARDDYCGWFENVLTVCGSLPCPPYAANQVVTCAVCSK